MCSFLIRLLVLPKLSEDKEETNDHLMHIAILNDVVMLLKKRPKGEQAQGSFIPLTIDNYPWTDRKYDSQSGQDKATQRTGNN